MLMTNDDGDDDDDSIWFVWNSITGLLLAYAR